MSFGANAQPSENQFLVKVSVVIDDQDPQKGFGHDPALDDTHPVNIAQFVEDEHGNTEASPDNILSCMLKVGQEATFRIDRDKVVGIKPMAMFTRERGYTWNQAKSNNVVPMNNAGELLLEPYIPLVTDTAITIHMDYRGMSTALRTRWAVIENEGLWDGDDSLRTRIAAPLANFQKVFVDGVEVDPSDYDLEEGSTIIKLKKKFLETLPAGNHTVLAEFNDNAADGGRSYAEYGFTAQTDSGGGGSYVPITIPAITVDKPLPMTDAKLEKSSYVYTGRQIKPGLIGLVAGRDYTAVYGANKNPGAGVVRVVGKGKYDGATSLSFKIVPGAPVLKKVKAGKRQVRVEWRRLTAGNRVAKYQVQYRVKGATKWKTVTVGAKKKALDLKKIKKGKRYEFRVRAYSKSSGVKYFGAWSPAKVSKKVK
jgi:hypothetical protein